MEIRQLSYFVTVAELGHFGRAAERLHIVQSAVSKQIASLERELGLTLFDRSHRQARLTPEGEAFLPHARRALREMDRAAEAAADLAAGTAGVLRLGSSPGLGKRLEDILTEFRARRPGALVRLTTTRSAPDKLAAVLAGDLDASFVSAPPEHPRLAVHHLWDDPLLLAVPAERASTADDLVSLASLPLARPARDENPEAFDLVTAACKAAGFMPRPGPTVVNAQDVLLGPVAAGHCWTLLPAHIARTGSDAVAFVPPRRPILLPTALVLLRAAPRSTAVDLLSATLKVARTPTRP
ncbi:LysR family transcriptional regulator [Amycolatopsis rhizosphaerae]|uniref:LysR family transcriptional regulator n=1 Tax=Amycolatopsis rhizosphaerae TaxID=2053003 RepID=A0A558B913_9PSEU|nr:LysR family transcriptional regulator [Amycolatopsis rhizosphaerae]TVT32993.1 LysR family transcriptional regulator [Amycolatopsis rhizosphaerae]